MRQDNSWANDIKIMHNKFGVTDWVENAWEDDSKQLMKLRMRMLAEEFNETLQAYLQGNAEETIDGLIDLCVISIGTLDICGVNAQHAWDEVYTANMAKEVGIKPNRPNPLGLPDLAKPADWVSPNHRSNWGRITTFL